MSDPTGIKNHSSSLAFRQCQLLIELCWLQPQALHLFELQHLPKKPVVGFYERNNPVEPVLQILSNKSTTLSLVDSLIHRTNQPFGHSACINYSLGNFSVPILSTFENYANLLS